MTNRHSFLSLAVALLASACATTAPKLDPNLRPAMTPLLADALSGSTECASPVVPEVKLGRGFKYGCFCGADYPDIKAPENLQSAAASRSELIAIYYRLRPTDDIDSACRDHDVCWIIHGDGDGKCNDELYRRLDYFAGRLRRDRGFFENKSLRWRCQILASDIKAAFLTLFVEANYKSLGTQAGTVIGKLVTAPLVATIPLLRLPVWAGVPYPQSGERCFLPDEAPQ